MYYRRKKLVHTYSSGNILGFNRSLQSHPDEENCVGVEREHMQNIPCT